jgi:hypothetical protein
VRILIDRECERLYGELEIETNVKGQRGWKEWKEKEHTQTKGVKGENAKMK